MSPDRQNSTKEGKLELCSHAGRSDRRRTKTRRIIIVATVSFLLGALFLSLNNFLHCPFLFMAFLFFSFLVAPILGIIAAVLWFPGKSAEVEILLIGVILVLGVLFLVTARMLLVVILLYVYTPPALTSENLVVYSDCIGFAKNRNQDKTLSLGRGRVVIDGNFYMLVQGNTFEMDRARRVFSEEEIIEMQQLCDRLFEVGCMLFRRDGDMLLFFKRANSALPVDPREACRILPTGPGVLYSLSGSNPNEIDSRVLNAAKPYTEIAGRWYTSRHLMFAGPRGGTLASIPESLFDHSLKTEGVELDNGPRSTK